jgi:hypothetical protein
MPQRRIGQPPNQLTVYESSGFQLGNPLIEDRP